MKILVLLLVTIYTVSVAQGDDNGCFDVKLTTKRYGSEISWSLGSCQGNGGYGNYGEYTEQCCLEPGDYNLECKDSYGDGWHGGYIEVNGEKYCESFSSGSEKNSQIIIEGKGLPFEVLSPTIFCLQSSFITTLEQCQVAATSLSLPFGRSYDSVYGGMFGGCQSYAGKVYFNSALQVDINTHINIGYRAICVKATCNTDADCPSQRPVCQRPYCTAGIGVDPCPPWMGCASGFCKKVEARRLACVEGRFKE